MATTVSFSVLVGFFALTMLVWLGRGAPFGHETVETVLMLNPMAAALSVIKARGFAEYDLLTGNWLIMLVACGIMTIALGVQTWRLTKPQ